MLKDTGASAVIVGHSKRRQRNTDNDATVGARRRMLPGRPGSWQSSVSARQRLSGGAARHCLSAPIKLQVMCRKARMPSAPRLPMKRCGRSGRDARRLWRRSRRCTRIFAKPLGHFRARTVSRVTTYGTDLWDGPRAGLGHTRPDRLLRDHGPVVIGLRSGHLWRPADPVRCRAIELPDGLVPRIDGDADHGDRHHPHQWQTMEGSSKAMLAAS